MVALIQGGGANAALIGCYDYLLELRNDIKLAKQNIEIDDSEIYIPKIHNEPVLTFTVPPEYIAGYTNLRNYINLMDKDIRTSLKYEVINPTLFIHIVEQREIFKIQIKNGNYNFNGTYTQFYIKTARDNQLLYLFEKLALNKDEFEGQIMSPLLIHTINGPGRGGRGRGGRSNLLHRDGTAGIIIADNEDIGCR